MTFHKYKDKVVKGLAMLIVAIMLLGAFAPIVLAEESEGTNPPVEEDSQEEEDSEEENQEEIEEPSEDEATNLPVEVIGIYPESKNEYQWFNEENLNHDIRDHYTRGRLFLKVSFDDVEQNLSFDDLNGLMKLRDFTNVYSDSSSVSVVDIEFLNDIHSMEAEEKKELIETYIFRKDSANKRAYLYIPVKPLMSHMSYSVTLGQGIVFNEHGNGNDTVAWRFNTMAIPSLAEKDVFVQSVIEDYDINEPIIITGKFFYSPTVDVYFNNERAYRVRTLENEAGEEYLEVYLPRGRNKLDPGLYDITVENSYSHSRWLYGALSVVSEADRRIPVEESKYSTTTSFGEVNGARRSEAIRLDHAEPIKEQILRNQLKQYTLKSPIIKVEAVGFGIYRFSVDIPVEKGIYEDYKVLRYDELSRIWIEEAEYSIDSVDQRVNLATFNSGIFVVVEPQY